MVFQFQSYPKSIGFHFFRGLPCLETRVQALGFYSPLCLRGFVRDKSPPSERREVG
jgi:hypothetical protein